MNKVFYALVLVMLVAVLFGKSDVIAPLVSTLDGIDKQLMLLLNHDGGRVADVFWRLMSLNAAWITLGAVFLLSLKGMCFRECMPVVMCLVLTLVLCDQLSSSFFKPYFGRLRPSHCYEISGLLHYVGDYRGGLHGFVSSHAANAFGIATYVSLLFRNKRITTLMVLWASCVSYSRIYLGVHYPGDVVGGAIVGFSMGMLCHRIMLQVSTALRFKTCQTGGYNTQVMAFQQVMAMSVFFSTASIFCYSCAVSHAFHSFYLSSRMLLIDALV